MALEGRNTQKQSKNEVVKGPLDLVKTPMQRMEQMGRRGMIKLGAAAGASYLVAEVATPLTAPMALEKVMPERPSDLTQAQRAEIENELKRFEEARKKGVANWAEKWWENARKGFEKHGLDLLSSIKEFSEEGLRARVLKYDILKESYDSAYRSGYGIVYYGFYAAYAAATFYVVDTALSDYFKHKSVYEKDLKTQNAVNTGAAELEDLKAEMESLRAKMGKMEKRPVVSQSDFSDLIEEIKKLDTKASPILRGLVYKFSEASAAQKDEEK